MESLFMQFCKYVDESIFLKENRGESVAFIIDQAFIDDFCKKFLVSEDALLKDVRLNLNRASKNNHLHIKGILAIQLYAATKREDTEKISASNYRKRLCQILNWDLNKDLKPWMKDNQDNYWGALYTWCEQNDFLIAQYKPCPGPWRYVQYPIQQAARVFTQKDLKDIAYNFVRHKLKPGEDISEHDFWRILKKKQLPNYVHTSHGRRIIEESEYLQDAYKQIYNFYLRWDGEYLDIGKNKSAKISKEQHFLYLSEDGYIDVRDKNMRLEKHISWDALSITLINSLYSFKREEQWILFRKNEDYEGYWEETRYLECLEDGKGFVYEDGIAVVFSNNDSLYKYSGINSFNNLTPFYINREIKIYKLQYSYNLKYLYAEKRFFRLDGGLKIGRMQYLLGGAPILQISKECRFWIDGEKSYVNSIVGHLSLNFLPVGSHDIKFTGFKKIEFQIINPESINSSWDKSYTKWLFSCKDKQWLATKSEEGIVGLDYSIFKIKSETKTDTTVLTRWAKFHLMGKRTIKEKNVAIKLLNEL